MIDTASLNANELVSKLKSGETTTSSNGGAAYDFAIFALSIAAAAIILAIISLVKRK